MYPPAGFWFKDLRRTSRSTRTYGSLDRDRFLRAILQLRNTSDPDCNVSPAQIVFGRPLRDAFASVNRLEKFMNPDIRPLWRRAWALKEDALRTRMTRMTESLGEHSRPLRPLAIGDRVFIQNQTGADPTKWDRSGTIVESPGNDQYRVKVDGSGSLRNRRFLRVFTPATPSTVPPVTTPPSPGPVVDSAERPASDAQSPHDTPTSTPATLPAARGPLPDNPQAGDGGHDITHGPQPERLDGNGGRPTPLDPSLTTPGVPHTEVSPPAIRPRRSTRPPKIFEPESGRWIHR